MRLLSAAVVGILVSIFATAPAAAAVTITINIQPKYLIEGSVRPVVTISGATGNSTLTFRRFNNGNCEGSATLSSSRTASNGEHPAPELQTGNPGPYSLRVSFGGVNAPCQPFLLQRNVSVTAQLPRNTFEVGEKIEPALVLSGGSGDAAGQVEVGRWPSAGCGPGGATSAGILPVVSGQPQGSVNLQEGSLGARSFNAVYSGDERHSEAATACRDYTVGVYIRGRVYRDADGSGTADAAESGLAQVTVTLRRPQGGTTTETTKADGGYEFFVAAGGQYTLTRDTPAGFDKTSAEELTVQIATASVAQQDFGLVELPSTLLPFPTSSAGTGLPALDPMAQEPRAAEPFTWLRIVALALVVIAAVVLFYLVHQARARREDDPF